MIVKAFLFELIAIAIIVYVLSSNRVNEMSLELISLNLSDPFHLFT